jgi:hypothetical protein
MHRPNARQATRIAALGAALLLGLASLPPLPAAAQPATPPLAQELADALAQPPMTVGASLPIDLGRGQSAYLRLPEGAGDLVAETRRLEGDADTVMALVDAQGRVLDEDDDGGEENLASRIEIAATQRGALFLRVGLLEGGSGRFEVSLAQAPKPEPGAPARTLAEAAIRPALAVGETLRITLRGRQEAYFRLPDEAPDLLVLTRALATGTDTVLGLLDANGREVATDDDGGDEQLSSRLEVPAAQRRPLFLRAGTLGGGSFDLVLEPDAPTPGPSFPRSLREATAAPALELGQAVTLRLRRGQSAVFRLPEGDIAVLTRNLRRASDTVLTLLDAQGQEVTEDDDGGGGLASRIEVAASDARPAFVRARVLGDGAGEFDLVVEADASGPPTFPTTLQDAARAPMLQAGVAVPIRLRRGQSAYFLLPPGAHVVATQELRDGTDTLLELLDANGRMLAEDDDGGGGLASRLAVDGARKGDVFVRAAVLGDMAGAFELILLPGRR